MEKLSPLLMNTFLLFIFFAVMVPLNWILKQFDKDPIGLNFEESSQESFLQPVKASAWDRIMALLDSDTTESHHDKSDKNQNDAPPDTVYPMW